LQGGQAANAKGGRRWDDLDPGDHEIAADLRGEPVEAVLDEFRQSYRVMLAALNAVPEETLNKGGFCRGEGGTGFAEGVMWATAEHYAWAKEQVRRWCKSHAGAYLDRETILSRIRTKRRRLEQNLAEVPQGQMETPGVVGDWSVKDVVAHLVDWEERFLGWYKAGRRGEVPEVPAPGFSWKDLDLLNRQIYERHRGRSLAEVLEDFHASCARVLATVEAMSEDEILTAGRYGWLGENALVGPILANTANHYRWAKSHIRAWRMERGGADE
jgi:hypothetical protein